MEAVALSLFPLFAKLLAKAVGHRAISDYRKFKNVEKELIKLETTILQAKNLLSELDTNLYQRDILRKIEIQFRKLPSLCTEAQDLVDDIEVKIADRSKSVGAAIRSSLSIWIKVHVIIELRNKMDAVIANLTLLEHPISNTGSEWKPFNGDCPPKLEMPLIGRDDDITEIVEKLISRPSKGVSIIGMHGLGKSALAVTVLNHEKIVGHFDLTLWLHMLDGFINLDEAVAKLEDSKMHWEPHKSLLIVLDNLLDVRTPDLNAFMSHLRPSETDVELSSIKFLITTLNPSVSKKFGTTDQYLEPLLDENCKTVIMKNALLDNNNLSEKDLSLIADLLMERCYGVPLVAKILGFYLARCSDNELTTILNKEDDLWGINELREIYPILASSYRNLTPNQKNCFAYFSLFRPQKLNLEFVHFWVGEGFIPPPNEDSTLEATCIGGFADLSHRSLIQFLDDEKKSIHPLSKLSYKFAQSAASMTCIQLNDQGLFTSSSENINPLHLSLLYCKNSSSEISDQISKFTSLKTFLAPEAGNYCLNGKIPFKQLKALTSLRVLSLKGTKVVELPDSMNNFKHLRYLDISTTPIKSLPKTLYQLRTLQFLNLKNTPNLLSLPNNFRCLTNLLYLDWEISDINQKRLPSNIGDIPNLRSLPLFPVGVGEGHSITELQNMNCLEGSIWITNLENVKDGSEVVKVELFKKKYLNRIELQWTPTASMRNTVDKDILIGLTPYHLLKELKITNYGFEELPEWIQRLSMLQKIHLEGSKFSNLLPLGELRSLKILVLQEMENLQHMNLGYSGPLISDSRGSFLSLESLKLINLMYLKEWRGLELGDMPCLRDLKIENCPILHKLPPFNLLPSLKELEIDGCPELRPLTAEQKELLKRQCYQVFINGTVIKTSDSSPNQDEVIKFQGFEQILDSSGAVTSCSIFDEEWRYEAPGSSIQEGHT